MSYPYRVVVSKSVETTVNASDRASHKLKLTPILPEPRMREILEETLEKRGWTRRDDGTWESVREGGESLVCDPETMTVTASVEVSEQIQKERTIHASGDAWSRRDVDEARERLRQEVEERLEQEIEITGAEKEARRSELQQKIADRLAANTKERRRELNEIVMEVYAESLKEKAHSLGEVTEIHESRAADGTAYELTIRIAE